MPLISVIIGAIIVFLLIMWLLAIIGVAPFLGCYPRYSSSSTSVSNTTSLNLRANGNYSGVICAPQDPNCPQAKYGQWIKVALNIIPSAQIAINVSGQVSLCQAYSVDGQHNIIPRVSSSSPGMPVILPAAAGLISVANIYTGDQVQVTVGPNSTSPNEAVQASKLQMANCSPGLTNYSPICGRYSFYSGFIYLQEGDCNANLDTTSTCGGGSPSCPQDATGNVQTGIDQCGGVGSSCLCQCGGGKMGCRRRFTCYKYKPSGTLPQSYDLNSTVFAETDNIDIIQQLNPYPNNDYHGQNCPQSASVKSWLTLDTLSNGAATNSGLWYSFGSDPATLATLLPDDANAAAATYNKRYIYNGFVKANPAALQYQFYNSNNIVASNYTGGYVIYLKQTKCYRQNGTYASDPDDSTNTGYTNRGQINYLILPADQDPNRDPSLAQAAIGLTFDNGQLNTPINTDKNGYLWLLINNNPADYPNSAGDYWLNITQSFNATSNHKGIDVWTWITNLFIDKWQQTATLMFQNITCYHAQDSSSCTNLFNAITACLTLYLMIFGALFSLGAIQTNNIDFLTRVLKIILVGGLMNNNTFDFFNNYLFPLIFNATAEIMGSFFPSSNTLESALANFFASIYDVILADIFQIQMLALLSTGLTGIIFFVVIVISLLLFLIPIFEFIAIYLGASLIVAILMSLAPIFLVFMLFETTKYLFENWIKFTIRYIFEPVIMFAGIACLTQIFLIYIDYVLGFSVCWKCSAPFQIPFLDQIFPFLGSLKTVPIFCLYWLAPWGYDPISYNFAMNLTNVTALFIISFTTLRYANVASQICSTIFGDGATSANILTRSVATSVTSSIVNKLESYKQQGQSKHKGLEQNMGDKSTPPK